MSKNGISKHYIQSTNALVDLWGERLNSGQFVAMMYILNRTVRWDNMGEVIPRRHIQNGVPNTPTGPLGMTYRNWLRCTRVLRSEGLIQTENIKQGTVYEVVLTRLIGGPLRVGQYVTPPCDNLS